MARNEAKYYSIEELPLMLSVREAAKALRLGYHTVYDLVREGRLHSVTVGRRILIPKSAVEQFMSP